MSLFELGLSSERKASHDCIGIEINDQLTMRYRRLTPRLKLEIMTNSTELTFHFTNMGLYSTHISLSSHNSHVERGNILGGEVGIE